MELTMQTPQKTRMTPRDFFLHLGIMVALYVSSISLITLLFQIIDLAFPDMLQTYVDPYSSGIRWAIASIIIFFPTYIILGWLYAKDSSVNPEKKTLSIRKWLVYFTLFVTGLTIVIDLVVLLNSFLGGEISSRFILKVVSVLVVMGAIFTYYILNLRGVTEKKNIFRGFVVGVVVVVLLALGFGFYFMGSPTTARNLQFDDQRVSNLQDIQWQLINYWQQKQKLPTTLADLNDPISNYSVPVDPQSFSAYEYRIVSSTSFQLCATFVLPTASTISTRPTSIAGQSDSWNHETGRQCFTRTIDPQRYPPTTSKY